MTDLVIAWLSTYWLHSTLALGGMWLASFEAMAHHAFVFHFAQHGRNGGRSQPALVPQGSMDGRRADFSLAPKHSHDRQLQIP